MKRTLKRELKVLEIAKREALETSDMCSHSPCAPLGSAMHLETMCGAAERDVRGL